MSDTKTHRERKIDKSFILPIIAATCFLIAIIYIIYISVYATTPNF